VASATTGGAGSAQMYYIHPDHLNTPRLIANSTGTAVWRWDQGEPFGNDVPNNNPSGAGAFEFPLRFPGQYFDRETNLSYNFFRDYDPSIGRYIESDPIGLRAGLNTYFYARVNPLAFMDPDGLDACAPPPCRKIVDITREYSRPCPSSCVRFSGYLQIWTCWEYVRTREPRCVCGRPGGDRG